MSWIIPLSIRLKVFIIFVLVAVASLFFWRSDVIKRSNPFVVVHSSSPTPPDPYESIPNATPTTPDPYESIANATLGFQEVSVISLDSRPDRRNAVLAAARVTNIQLTLLNGITDAEVSREHVPEDWELEEHPHGQLGAYISHLTALDRIIREKITTAVIMESDADWDLRIRQTLPSVAKGIKNVMDYPFAENDDGSPSPQPGVYGDRWDVIWFGHCGSLGPYEGRVYQFNDTSAPPAEFDYTIIASDPPDPYIRPDHRRMVYELKWNLCSYAYAVTLEGARKLRRAGAKSFKPWDLRLNDICQEDPTVRCATVWPAIVTAAYSPPTIDYDGQPQGPPINHYMAGGTTPGPALQISARRNSDLVGPAISPADWLKEW